MSGNSSYWPASLPQQVMHLFLLTGLAVSQPLFSVISQNAEFLVVHHVTGRAVVLLALILSFVVPAVLVIPLLLCGTGNRLRKGVMVASVFLLVTVVVLPAVGRITESWIVILLVSTLVSAVFSVAYTRYAGFRQWLTFFSPAILVFPILFLFVSPAGGLLVDDRFRMQRVLPESRLPPVVLVILDELGTEVLLDEDGKIDRERFPGFAALADRGTWYRRATTVQLTTSQIVPAILTGRYPYAQEKSHLPILREYPENLFTWLGGTYGLNVSERITSLCPRELCGEEDRQIAWRVLLQDLFYLYLHIVIPDTAPVPLPDISAAWSGFGNHRDSGGNGVMHLPSEGRRFEEFLHGMRDTAPPGLHVIHSVLPHVPYVYLPDGRIYSIENGVPQGVSDEKWEDNPELVDLGYYRYLLQTAYTDRLISGMLTGLEDGELFDESLIIVTADHGVSFRPGLNRRDLTGVTYTDVLPVPLIVKYPFQREPEVDDRYVSNLDILPTIAEVLNIEPPWKMDGVSLLSGHSRTRIRIPFPDPSPDLFFDPGKTTAFSALEERIRRFGAGTGFDRFLIKGYPDDLLGQKVSGDGEAAGVGFVLYDEPAIRFVDPESGFLPVLVSGELRVEETSGDSYTLAVTVNGKVQAFARSFRGGDGKNRFSTILPATAFLPDRNAVAVYLVDQPEGSRARLLKITDEGGSWLETAVPREGVSNAEGKTAEDPVSRWSEEIRGFLDNIVISKGRVQFSGWAVDEKLDAPAEQVHLLVNGIIVHSAVVQGERRDVAAHFGDDRLLLSGYSFRMPLDVVRDALMSNHESTGLQLLATTPDRRVQRLKINPRAVRRARAQLDEATHEESGKPAGGNGSIGAVSGRKDG